MQEYPIENMTVNIACVSIITSLFPFKGTMAFFFTSFINPLNPKSDQHLISPYNIIPESHVKVMRIKEMITGEGWIFWLANKFSFLAP